VAVAWQGGADDCFEKALGWGVHPSVLHPGYYGYDQNKYNDGLLGLVALFKSTDSKKGQFHIGFGEFPDHFSADTNSNIANNYPDYCRWYGEITPYQTCSELGRSRSSSTAATGRLNSPPPAPPPPASDLIPEQTERALLGANPPIAALSQPVQEANTSAPGPPASTEDLAALRGTVSTFLNAWYRLADYGALAQFVAQDNFFHEMPQALPKWQSYFKAAFKPDSPKPKSLADAVKFPQITLPKGSPELRYANAGPARKLLDTYAIIDPQSAPRGAYFPPADISPDRLQNLNARARYLDHLRRAYPGRLYLVVYATKSPGLVREGVVLYWILEGSNWKLAIAQTTD
jgi:hypothetical protein